MSYSTLSGETVTVPGLSIWTHTEEKGIFLLEENPMFTFYEGDVVKFSAGNTTLLFSVSELKKIQIVEVEKGTSAMEQVDNEPVRFDIRQNQISVSNLSKAVYLEIYNLEGKLINRVAADDVGNAQVQIDQDMPKMLIVKAGSLTTKIVRK